jgi:zinc transporter
VRAPRVIALSQNSRAHAAMPPTLVTGIFGMNTKGLPSTDLDTAFLWASALMLLSSFAAYLIRRRIGILR